MGTQTSRRRKAANRQSANILAKYNGEMCSMRKCKGVRMSRRRHGSMSASSANSKIRLAAEAKEMQIEF